MVTLDPRRLRNVNTRTVYSFEEVYNFGKSNVWMSYRDSCRFVDRVWLEEVPDRLPPVVVPHEKWVDKMASGAYYFHDHQISVRPAVRSCGVLLHELTHAMGYLEHNPGFLAQLFTLLMKYCGCELGQLVMAAGFAGIVVR